MRDQKIALVTGGNSGIGKAVAEHMVKQNIFVVITARREAESLAVIDELNRKYKKECCAYIPCDLSNMYSIDILFDKLISSYKRIDFAINNAGIEGKSFTSLLSYPEDIWDEIMNVNVKSVWWCLKHEIIQMKKQETRGAIVNVSSVAGLKSSYSGGCGYTASKHALVGLTKVAAKEFAEENIRINAVCPAVVETPMAQKALKDKLKSVGSLHPLGRNAQPEEIAEAIGFLCSEKASFITGIALPIDGGILC